MIFSNNRKYHIEEIFMMKKAHLCLLNIMVITHKNLDGKTYNHESKFLHSNKVGLSQFELFQSNLIMIWLFFSIWMQ